MLGDPTSTIILVKNSLSAESHGFYSKIKLNGA